MSDDVPARLGLRATVTPRGADQADEVSIPQLLRFFRRNIGLITASVVCGLIVSSGLASRMTPVYVAATTLRIHDKEPTLPGIYKELSSASEVSTEAEELRSGPFAEDAVADLELQFEVVEPRGRRRAELFSDVSVARGAPAATFELRRMPTGQFRIAEAETKRGLATAGPGERVRLPGLAFRLNPATADYETITVAVQTFGSAVAGVRRRIQVDQPSRDAKVLKVQYRDSDPELAAAVPNLIVGRFIERRNEIHREEAQSTGDFLQEQIDRVSAQLATAETALRSFRERRRVVDPEAEASSQVTRLSTLQSERNSVESERTALAELLNDVDERAARRRPEDPSPYRALLAFPTLLRSQAASHVLRNLADAEQQRSALLTRRTPHDRDVRLMGERIRELESELRSMVATYLEGLARQVKTYDTELARFGRELSAVPETQLELARLERQPELLGQLLTLLQTRLKEAEIAQGARDPTLRVVAQATPPLRPRSSKRLAIAAAGLVAGLVIGVASGVVRESRDRTVHTRADLSLVTPLPVLGLIPRIRGPRKRIASIATASAGSQVPWTALRLPASPGSTYTFLDSEPVEEAPATASGLVPASRSAGPAPHSDAVWMRLSDAGKVVVEAYSMLQTNIQFCRPGDPVRLIVVTSALPNEGKTTSAINLSLTLATRGLRVLLVDADLRHGMLHEAFDTPREPGLSDVLLGTASFERACRAVHLAGGSGLTVVTAGARVPNPSAAIESGAAALLTRLREAYDVVVVDSPPANVVTDAALLAASADGVLLIARAGVTNPGALTAALEQLEHVGAPLLGVVLNDIDPKRDAAYGGSYRYYNYAQYAAPADR